MSMDIYITVEARKRRFNMKVLDINDIPLDQTIIFYRNVFRKFKHVADLTKNYSCFIFYR